MQAKWLTTMDIFAFEVCSATPPAKTLWDVYRPGVQCFVVIGYIWLFFVDSVPDLYSKTRIKYLLCCFASQCNQWTIRELSVVDLYLFFFHMCLFRGITVTLFSLFNNECPALNYNFAWFCDCGSENVAIFKFVFIYLCIYFRTLWWQIWR